MARTLVASDDFNRADVDPITGNWTDLNGANSRIKILSNAIQASHGNNAAARWTGTGTFTNDQYSSVQIPTWRNTSSRIGAIVRASADTAANRDHYGYRITDTVPSTTVLFKIVNGTETSLDSSTSVTWTNSDRVECESEGTTIRGLKNGTSQISVTDSALTTGQPGVTAYYAGGTAVQGDNWEAGSLAAAAGGGVGSLLGSQRNSLLRS